MRDKRESAVRSCLWALTESIKQVPLVYSCKALTGNVRRSLAELEIVYGGYSYALGETVISSLPLLGVFYVDCGHRSLVRS